MFSLEPDTGTVRKYRNSIRAWCAGISASYCNVQRRRPLDHVFDLGQNLLRNVALQSGQAALAAFWQNLVPSEAFAAALRNQCPSVALEVNLGRTSACCAWAGSTVVLTGERNTVALFHVSSA